MRTRGCWRNLFKTEDRCEVCSIDRPYHVSTVHQDALFTNIIPQSHQLNRAGSEELTRHVHSFYISTLRRPFLTGLGCPIVCLSQRKFRDEIRPRFGLMRGREFIMKDACS